MGRNIKFVIVFAVLVGICAVVEKGDAATYVVGGDSLGWTIPSGGASDYSSWASKHVFRIGDNLVFKFVTGAHDVATVTRAAFDGCNSSGPISLITLGPANVTLNSPGEVYFICTFSQHCSIGQKLAINVSAASTPAPSPTPAAPAPPPIITPPAAPVPAPAPRISPPEVPAPAPTPPGAPAPAPTPSTGGTSPSPSPESTPAPPPGEGATPPSPPAPPSAPTPGSTPPPPPPPPNSAATRAIATSFVIFASIAMGIAF